MKLAVLGASGETGVLVVIQALQSGDSVKAIVRNKDKLVNRLKAETLKLKKAQELAAAKAKKEKEAKKAKEKKEEEKKKEDGEAAAAAAEAEPQQETNEVEEETVEEIKELSEHENLTIAVVEDIFNEDNLTECFGDVEAVISTLGFPVARNVTEHEKATKAMVGAMKKNEGGCRRLILMHSWFTEQSTRSKAPFYIRWTLLLFIAPILDNMRVAEKYLETEEDVNYTVVLPPGLTKKPVTDLEFKVKEDDWLVEGGCRTSISRADVARYLLKSAKENLHEKKVVAIATV